ncbi:MAG TPA: preprotein translocase subunit YajC [Thermoanaerobaculia bacterium]|nr:preprotein translocase subunit YajC [Thermoanaerobaculia bacterium]
MIPIRPDWMLAFQGGSTQSTWLVMIPYLFIAVIFYFLLIAPMKKRQKALSQMVDSLKKGDRIVTSGGIYGEIAGVDGDTVILKVADNVRIKLAKSAIAGLEKEGETPK